MHGTFHRTSKGRTSGATAALQMPLVCAVLRHMMCKQDPVTVVCIFHAALISSPRGCLRTCAICPRVVLLSHRLDWTHPCFRAHLSHPSHFSNPACTHLLGQLHLTVVILASPQLPPSSSTRLATRRWLGSTRSASGPSCSKTSLVGSTKQQQRHQQRQQS